MMSSMCHPYAGTWDSPVKKWSWKMNSQQHLSTAWSRVSPVKAYADSLRTLAPRHKLWQIRSYCPVKAFMLSGVAMEPPACLCM